MPKSVEGAEVVLSISLSGMSSRKRDGSFGPYPPLNPRRDAWLRYRRSFALVTPT